MAQQSASWTAAPDAGVVAGATSAATTTSVRFGGRAAARTVARPRLLPLRVGCWRPLTWQSDASTIQHCRIGLGVKCIVVCSPASPANSRSCCGQGHGCDARAADKDTAADSSAESCSNKKMYMRGRFSFETDLRHRKNFKTRFKRKPAEPKVSVSVRRASASRASVLGRHSKTQKRPSQFANHCRCRRRSPTLALRVCC